MGRANSDSSRLESAVGLTLVSNWHTIDQLRINEDPDPTHIDPEWARAHGPWGGPIAFGFLTISMLTPMAYDVFDVRFDGSASCHHASYGFNRLRLVEPVPAGSRIRAQRYYPDHRFAVAFQVNTDIDRDGFAEAIQNRLAMLVAESLKRSNQ